MIEAAAANVSDCAEFSVVSLKLVMVLTSTSEDVSDTVIEFLPLTAPARSISPPVAALMARL